MNLFRQKVRLSSYSQPILFPSLFTLTQILDNKIRTYVMDIIETTIADFEQEESENYQIKCELIPSLNQSFERELEEKC